MAWQPFPANDQTAPEERLIATGGDDCAILVWNARVPESKATCFLTMDSPIQKIAFTPDGAFLAGATSSQVLIWKVGNYAMPRASWSSRELSGWVSPKANAEPEEEDEYSLCWDCDGQKLAYGSNNRVSIFFAKPLFVASISLTILLACRNKLLKVVANTLIKSPYNKQRVTNLTLQGYFL